MCHFCVTQTVLDLSALDSKSMHHVRVRVRRCEYWPVAPGSWEPRRLSLQEFEAKIWTFSYCHHVFAKIGRLDEIGLLAKVSLQSPLAVGEVASILGRPAWLASTTGGRNN